MSNKVIFTTEAWQDFVVTLRRVGSYLEERSELGARPKRLYEEFKKKSIALDEEHNSRMSLESTPGEQIDKLYELMRMLKSLEKEHKEECVNCKGGLH